MKLKQIELLRKLPVPFDTVVDWMKGNPPLLLYLKHLHVLDTDKSAHMLVDLSLDYLMIKMMPPHELLEIGYLSLQAFRELYEELPDPANDRTMQELAAVIYQLVSNTLDMVENLRIGPCGGPLEHEIVVMLTIYPHP